MFFIAFSSFFFFSLAPGSRQRKEMGPGRRHPRGGAPAMAYLLDKTCIFSAVIVTIAGAIAGEITGDPGEPRGAGLPPPAVALEVDPEARPRATILLDRRFMALAGAINPGGEPAIGKGGKEEAQEDEAWIHASRISAIQGLNQADSDRLALFFHF